MIDYTDKIINVRIGIEIKQIIIRGKRDNVWFVKVYFV